MKLLVLVPSKDGHHLEYVEHIALLADQRPDDEFVFSLHPGLEKFESINLISQKSNVTVDYLSEEDVKTPKGGRLVESFKLCRLLKKKNRQYSVTDVFLIMLTPFGPIIYLPIWGNVKISSILYSLYPYKIKSESFLRRWYEYLCYWLMSKNNNLKNIYVLNDPVCSRLFNIKYKATKFKYIVDPYRPISAVSAIHNLRERYPNKQIVSHIGFLKERKGSFDILRAISSMDTSVLDKYLFVFAGGTSSPGLMRQLVQEASTKADILYIDGFLPFEEIGEIVSSSDLLLLPYHNTNQSSGIIGYGAQYNVPVAVPDSDLLAKLVRRYNLGYTMSGHSVEDIIKFLNECDFHKYEKSSYVEVNNAKNFVQIISSNL